MSITRMNENPSEKLLSSDINWLQQLMSKDVMDIISYLTRRSELSASITCIIGGMKPEKSGNAGDDPKVLIPEGLCVLFDNSPPTGESKARLMRMPSPGFVFNIDNGDIVDRIDLIQIKADFYEANQQSRDKWVGPGAQDWTPTNFYKELSNSFLELGVVKNDTIQYKKGQTVADAGYEKLCEITMLAGGTTNASVIIDLTEYNNIFMPAGHRLKDEYIVKREIIVTASMNWHCKLDGWAIVTNQAAPPYEDYVTHINLKDTEEYGIDIPLPRISSGIYKEGDDYIDGKIEEISVDCVIMTGEELRAKLYGCKFGEKAVLIGSMNIASSSNVRTIEICTINYASLKRGYDYFIRFYKTNTLYTPKIYAVKFNITTPV